MISSNLMQSFLFSNLAHRESWADFQQKYHHIDQTLNAQAQGVHPIIRDITARKGKQLRAQLVFFIAQLLDNIQTDHHRLACIIEYLHWASLLHDDVLDQGEMRRQRPCMHKDYGNTLAILGGDWYVAQAFSLVLTLQDRRVMETVQGVMKPLVQGQMMDCSMESDAGQDDYLTMIGYKTAELFAVSAQAAAMIAGASHSEMDALRTFGHAMGMAYQLQDDGAEYAAPVESWDFGHDFYQNKFTLPWILTRQSCSVSQWSEILDVQNMVCIQNDIDPGVTHAGQDIDPRGGNTAASFASAPRSNWFSVMVRSKPFSPTLDKLHRIQTLFQEGVNQTNALAQWYKDQGAQAVASWPAEVIQPVLQWGSF
ncbi:MAG: polyprenyl synthetase family protein [Alphaproteobacteria bacterium]|nr:polyprenyl synthetase family protein [Alphaproteobacteria bacterium]